MSSDPMRIKERAREIQHTLGIAYAPARLKAIVEKYKRMKADHGQTVADTWLNKADDETVRFVQREVG